MRTLKAVNIWGREIYGGKDPEWEGWHNLVMDIGEPVEDSKPIQGPIDPETSKQIFLALNNIRAEAVKDAHKHAINNGSEHCPESWIEWADSLIGK